MFRPSPAGAIPASISSKRMDRISMAPRIGGGLGINHGCSPDYCQGCRDSGKECCMSFDCGWLLCHFDCMCCNIEVEMM
jgi:hypothetical protein